MKGIKHIVTGSNFVSLEFTAKKGKGLLAFDGEKFYGTKPFVMEIPYAQEDFIGGLRVKIDSGTGRVDFYTQD